MTATEVKPSSVASMRGWLTAHWRIIGFPIAVLVLLVLLVGANLNGSSLGVIATKSQLENSLIAGTPRDLRSDEFMVNADCSWRNGADGCLQRVLQTLRLGVLHARRESGPRVPLVVAAGREPDCALRVIPPAGGINPWFYRGCGHRDVDALRRLVDVVSALCDRGGSSG
jgi:hypothetical protein